MRIRIRIIVPALLSALCLSAPARACLLRVPTSYPTLQSALDATADGDTVLVAAGIYRGPGNRGLDFGGKNVALLSEAGATATLLDCEERERAFVFSGGEGTGVLVRGFTIRGGRALGEGSAGKGGALYCSGASPRFEACVFTDSEALFGGAVAGEWDSSPSFVACVFRDNFAYFEGGALHLFGGGGGLRNCVLAGNRAREAGQDLYLCESWAQIEDCRFEDALPPQALAQP